MEKRYPDWDWQEDFDWHTQCSEIRDFGDREAELKNRLGVPLETESEERRGLEEQYEEEFEWQMGQGKEGVRELLSRIYANGELSDRQKEDLKEKLLEGDTSYNAMLLALFDGAEKNYAKRWLVEKVIGRDRYIEDLVKSGVVRIRSERGWVKEVNGVVLPKAIRSDEFIQHISDWRNIGTTHRNGGTITVWKKPEITEKPFLKPVEPSASVEVVPIVKPFLSEREHKTPAVERKIESLVTIYSYADILKMAKENNIRQSKKSNMISRLIDKGVL